MKVYIPEYYNKFKCIAEKCRHNCCIGWEIDIDEYTLEIYESINTDFGKKIRDNIVYEDDIAYFRLQENDRCPFLNKDNLCDIIINSGDGAICDICAEHPRFRNYYADRCEIGLGLCCEEAARIILCEEMPFGLKLDEEIPDMAEVSLPDFDNFLNLEIKLSRF